MNNEITPSYTNIDPLDPEVRTRLRLTKRGKLVLGGVAVVAVAGIIGGIASIPKAPEHQARSMTTDIEDIKKEATQAISTGDANVVFTIPEVDGAGVLRAAEDTGILESDAIDPSNSNFSDWTLLRSSVDQGIAHSGEQYGIKMQDINGDGLEEPIVHPIDNE